MAGNQALKRRIKSAKSIRKITKAMQTVSGSKMVKSQKRATVGRDYNSTLWEMVQHVVAQSDSSHPFMSAINKAAPALTIIISSDRGLCGAFNTNLFRGVEKQLAATDSVITLGKKSTLYSRKTTWKVIATIDKLGDFPAFDVISAAAKIAIEEFLKGNVSSVTLAYQKFINTLKSEVTFEQILPIPMIVEEATDISKTDNKKYIFEPNSESLLADLLLYSINSKTYQAVLSSKAAEQSARMVAMKNASTAAGDLQDGLQRVYNKEYQKTITAEISDVVTASMALKK